MARNKSKRDLKFKPQFKSFAPLGIEVETIILLHEEIEAIYLMDYQNLYQEDAALSMGVSRTTFSRIIKSARTKIATALINGKKLIIQDEKKGFCVAFICEDSASFGQLSVRNEQLVFVQVDEKVIKNIEIIKNPIYNSDQKPTHVLPKLLLSKGVNYFLSADAGEGLQSSLAAKGIFTISKDSLHKEELESFLLPYM
jgi:predicted DNA-binding protein (UPF0251 family)/predicted Fe-Mo cluster-binding NifX family protein